MRERLRREVVYLHQFPYMFDASVADNVAYGLARHGIAPKARQQRVQQALAQVGLEHLSEADAKPLSGGERQRVALARALVLSPQIVLLDEPTASLDQTGREQLLPLLQQLKQRGLACAIVSHDVTALGHLPDSYLRLDGGRLAPVASPAITPLPPRDGRSQRLPLGRDPWWEGAHG
jgi:tungstate transport system ATP-binding protein